MKITFTGDGASAYAERLPPFLAIGDIGLAGALRAFADKRWKYNWDFYLPLGLPLAQNKAVQLLHFPPDYVLKEVQDYLQANTTKRWAALLIENGADAAETDAYQAIVDIAPVSAPASDGQKLEGIYKYFTSYIDGLLDFWTIDSKSGNLKPLVAFGGPVREYLKDRYGLDLNILGLGEIPVKGGRHAPVLSANHPSRFYNAINAYLDEHKNDVVGAVHMGMKIQHDDLIAACWEVAAAKDISAPDATLTTCQARWENRDADICKLVILQRFPDDADAAKVCEMDDLATYRSITEAQIEAIEAAQESTAMEVQ
ncbi:hypothetical protein [Mesorhizobium captivum]|uniref:hypothetical protein n=1 Tax=Mesorhizobium captivum TaxID=3072319 RepID=UPI002A23BB3E|nr:hypothetical protein [Mesorhizobium sp. VK3C]MDX8450477.1 hypothetical protein [Mesorhizobium sp. VK3C]